MSDAGPLVRALGSRARITGRYAIFFQGRECGGERFELSAEGGGIALEAEQETGPPHPVPSRHLTRAVLGPNGRPEAVDITWTVGGRRLHATHRADGGTWRVRIESEGRVREQHGDFPPFAEVEFPSALFAFAMLARRDFAPGGEHEFPVLRIGPPLMAVSPERMRVRCVERGVRRTPRGEVAAKRYVLSLPPRGEDEGYTFWADEDGFPLEAFEGPDALRPWMRLVEMTGGS